jgi:leukotriene-A4 hydrolase
VLDSKLLTIIGVYDTNLNPLDYYLDESRTLDTLGTPLNITFGQVVTKGSSVSVTIMYITDPNAPAIQWLTPEMTYGKKYPFMYTQGEAILG